MVSFNLNYFFYLRPETTSDNDKSKILKTIFYLLHFLNVTNIFFYKKKVSGQVNKNPRDFSVVSLYIIEYVTHEKPLSFVAYVCSPTQGNLKDACLIHRKPVTFCGHVYNTRYRIINGD